MDSDTTVRGFDLTQKSTSRVFQVIARTNVDDDWAFDLVRAEDIREGDEYPGIRVHLLTARHPPKAVPLTVDVTTGDRITPDAVSYVRSLLFDDGTVTVLAYPLETAFAEKPETVMSRGVTNTRPRDYYDIKLLWETLGNKCNPSTLAQALTSTCDKRNSVEAILRASTVLDEVAADTTMLQLWSSYVRKNPYAAQITLGEYCEIAKEVFQARAAVDSDLAVLTPPWT
jgi:hypothetical protein